MQITDEQHLQRLVRGIVQNAAALGVAWRAEEAAACAPSRNPDAVRTSGAPSDPTFGAATRDKRWHDRDQVGAIIAKVAKQLEQDAARLT